MKDKPKNRGEKEMNARRLQRAAEIAANNAEESESIMGPMIGDYREGGDSDSDSEDRDTSFEQQKIGQKRKLAAVQQRVEDPVLPSIALALEEGEEPEEEEEEEGGQEEEEEEDVVDENGIVTDDEATRLLGQLFDAHTKRTVARNESKTQDQIMKECKRLLIPFMKKHNREKIGIKEEDGKGKYFNSKYKEKNRGVRKNDLLQMVERDYGAAKKQQYERELQTLAKQKVRVLDNRVTYIGMRVAGERNSGAAPPRVRPAQRNVE